MAFLGMSFDASTIATSSFGILPAGEYLVQITESSVGPNSKGTGVNLKLTFDVIDGEFKGRKVFDSLCIQHNSDKAQQIAQESLAKIVKSIGFTGKLEDSAALHFKPLKITVKIREASGGYNESNDVTDYKPASAAKSFSAPSQPAAYAAAPAGGAPAWAKKAA